MESICLWLVVCALSGRENIPSIRIAVLFDEYLLGKFHLLIYGQAIGTKKVVAESEHIIMREVEWKIGELCEARGSKDLVQPGGQCC